MRKRLIVGITGASGALIGVSLVRRLLAKPLEVHLVVTRDGRMVMEHEMGAGARVLDLIRERYGDGPHPDARLFEHRPDSFFSPPASGSFRHHGMAVAPCSMKTLAAVAAGHADNLLTRAADVCLKERRPLVLVPRETPLGRIHLENMLRVTDAGGVILPPVPGFYRRPETIEDLLDFVTGRILDHLGIPNDLVREWGDDDPTD